MKVIIFAGGLGKRLWPVSRSNNPKQFQKIYGDETSLENSFNTIKNKFDVSDIFVSTGADFVEDVLKTLLNLPPSNLILEPTSKDTGPAVTYAMIKIHQKFPNEPVLIRWQNSIIKNTEAFIKALDDAEKLFLNNEAEFVYLAVPSKFPNINVGYIQATFEKLLPETQNEVRQFVRFTEKPDIDTAKKYQRSNDYFWNPGCYITTPNFVLDSLKQHNKEMFDNFVLPIKHSIDTEKEWDVTRICFENVKKESIDYLLWEKLPSKGIKVIKTDYDWHYVSTWSDIKDALVNEYDSNFLVGDTLLANVKNSVVANFSNKKILAVYGVKDLVIVSTDDAVLVVSKDNSGKVKDLVYELEKQGKTSFI